MATLDELIDRITQLEDKLESLSEKTQNLEDIEAIKKLKALYGQLVDDRYEGGQIKSKEDIRSIAGRVSELFTEDAVWDGGRILGICRGRQEIYERFLNPAIKFGLHYFVKPDITVEGDRALGRWYLLSPFTTNDDVPFWMAALEDDEYMKVNSQWLQNSMKLKVIFSARHDRGWAKSSIA
ncbi:nuclear transport factor 2 family protein [Chloroflexota bacterium]